jgi:chromosome segregation ATPase
MWYLITQTWLFLLIAWLIGIAVGFGISKDKKSQRHSQVEDELREERSRTIALGKDVEEFRSRVTELEGLPQGVRASKVAAREEMIARLTQVERELEGARASEKRLNEEAERLRADVDGFRQRYLEARAKWDEYKAKADALAQSPAQLTLTEAHVVPDDSLRKRVMELEALLAEGGKARERALEQSKVLTARVGDLERQLAAAGSGSEKAGEQSKGLQTKVNDLEVQLASTAAGRDQALEQTKLLTTRVGELEAQLSSAGKGSERANEQTRLMQARVSELEARLAAGISTARETDALRSRVADLQDKLGEAEVALSRAITVSKQEPASDALAAKAISEAAHLRVRVGELERQLGEAQLLATEAQSLKGKIALLEARGSGDQDARIQELERALDRARRQASEAQSLQVQVQSLETRLATAHSTLEQRSGVAGEDVGLLKARLADLEARVMATSSSSAEFESLRSRVMTLEALLHEAAKSRDEAAILRTKVAELDGRLGQAMKAVADGRSSRESEKV